MPSWSLGDLCSQATKRAGNRSDMALSDVSFWVNQAYQDFVRDVPQMLSERTTYFSVNSGTSQLTVPADFLEAVVLSWDTNENVASERTLNQIAPEHADAQGYYPVGKPQGYFIWNDKIQLWPSANSSEDTNGATSGRSYLLRYRALPADMTALTAVPSVATEQRLGILYRAEKYLHELVGNHEEAAAAEYRYTALVGSLKDAKAKRDAARGRFAVSYVDGSSRRRGGSFTDPHDRWLRT